jgi:hypothetical protein
VYKLRHLINKPPPVPVPAGTLEAMQVQSIRASFVLPLARSLVREKRQCPLERATAVHELQWVRSVWAIASIYARVLPQDLRG